jgi:hypothetical protein
VNGGSSGKRRLGVCWLGVALSLLSACGSGGAGSGSSDAAPETSGVSRSPEITVISPLDELAGLGTGPRSRIAYQRAIQESVAGCMRARGWEYASLALPLTPVLPLDSDGAIAWADEHGYGLLGPAPADPEGARKSAQDANDRYISGLPKEEVTRYNADLTGDGGCGRTASATLTPHFAFFHDDIMAAVVARKGEVVSSGVLEDAATGWHDCMAEAGIATSGLESGRALFNEQVEAGKVSQKDLDREREVAGLDARCLAEFVWPTQAVLEQSAVDAVVSEFGFDKTCGLTC